MLAAMQCSVGCDSARDGKLTETKKGRDTHTATRGKKKRQLQRAGQMNGCVSRKYVYPWRRSKTGGGAIYVPYIVGTIVAAEEQHPLAAGRDEFRV